MKGNFTITNHSSSVSVQLSVPCKAVKEHKIVNAKHIKWQNFLDFLAGTWKNWQDLSIKIRAVLPSV